MLNGSSWLGLACTRMVWPQKFPNFFYRIFRYSQHICSGQTARAMKVLLLNDGWTAPAAGAKPVPTVAGHLEAPCTMTSTSI